MKACLILVFDFRLTLFSRVIQEQLSRRGRKKHYRGHGRRQLRFSWQVYQMEDQQEDQHSFLRTCFSSSTVQGRLQNITKTSGCLSRLLEPRIFSMSTAAFWSVMMYSFVVTRWSVLWIAFWILSGEPENKMSSHKSVFVGHMRNHHHRRN